MRRSAKRRKTILEYVGFYKFQTTYGNVSNMGNPSRQDKAILSAVFAKMDIIAMAGAMGALFSLGLFIATAVLLLQDVPAGYPVGPHLNALQDYLPGFSVSWLGSIAGLIYGFLIGAVLGFFLAVLWNMAHFVALGAMLIKSAVLAD